MSITLEPDVTSFLLSATSKALATISADGSINVVPVSSIRVKDGRIVLVNYFMEKTLDNILAHPEVALVAWKDMIGYQIKGMAHYETSGMLFDEIVTWVNETIPGRVVKGIILITPTELYDIAPDKKTKETYTAQ